MQNETSVFVLVRLYFVRFRVIYIIYNQMREFIVYLLILFLFGEEGGGGRIFSYNSPKS